MRDIQIDEIGPSKVIQLSLPQLDISAIVVVDSTALGPAIGGVRVSRSIATDEVLRLSRSMTLKNALAGLPHGGAQAAILADPKDPRRERLFRAFGRAIRDLVEYIPCPDRGSDEQCMAWLYEETGRAAVPALDKPGAAGFGLAECAEIACPYAGFKLIGSAVAIQGFGSVGRAMARFLVKKGAIVVAASDTKGTLYTPYGTDVEKLIASKESSGSVVNYPHGKVSKPGDIFSLPCDILVPAAAPDAITPENAPHIKAKVVLEGADIPLTADAEELLHQRGVLAVPDIIANAGGAIMAAAEYANKTGQEAFEAVAVKIRESTGAIVKKSKAETISPRRAALAVARERIIRAMEAP